MQCTVETLTVEPVLPPSCLNSEVTLILKQCVNIYIAIVYNLAVQQLVDSLNSGVCGFISRVI